MSEDVDSGAGGLQPFVSQETDEWATPPEFVRPLADALGGFDLDPCSGAEKSPIASETYTAEDDGLAQPWHGNVWLNPPYSELGVWLRKTLREMDRGYVECVIALVKGDTSTDWYQRYAILADAIAFIDDRLAFGGGSSTAPFPSHVLVYGEVPDEVYRILSRQGVVLSPGDRYQFAEQERLV